MIFVFYLCKVPILITAKLRTSMFKRRKFNLFKDAFIDMLDSRCYRY